MRTKTYLITGGAGFIGTHLTNHILDKGHEVLILDHNIMDNAYMSYDGDVSVFNGDIRDKGLATHLISKADAVFHLAAQVDVMESFNDPLETFSVNTFGTLLICDIAKYHDVPVVFTSSAATYGDGKVPMKESAPQKPMSPYGLSKMLAEMYLNAYNEMYGMSNINLRLFNVLGPGKFKGLLHNMITGMLNDERVTIYGSGEQTRDFISVDDVCEAIWRAGNLKKLSGTFNIGSGKETSVNDAVSMLSKMTKTKSDIHYEKQRSGEIERSCADISLARKHLTWKPNVSLKKGLSDLVTWYDDVLMGGDDDA